MLRSKRDVRFNIAQICPEWNGERNDDPTILSTPQKITAAKQIVRKSFLHQSWSEMSMASELSGRDALVRIQNRVGAYWGWAICEATHCFVA
jgi:hypothetical protein